MTKNIFIDKTAEDKRIAELTKIYEAKGYVVHDFLTKEHNVEGDSIAYLLPRNKANAELIQNLPHGTKVFGYEREVADELLKPKNLTYVSLSDDAEFIRETNYQTALAMREILEKRFKKIPKKILIIGWGKLCEQLEKVLSDTEIHILNFNHHRAPEMQKIYGERAHFQTAVFSNFDVVINTIPKELVGAKLLRPIAFCSKCKIAANPKTKTTPKPKPVIYELASPPYGFDWAGLNKESFDYTIEPALPGRYYPDQAAASIQRAICRHITCGEQKPTIVLCVTGSACSYTKLLPVLTELVKTYDVIPVLSESAGRPNRFTNIDEFKESLREITGNKLVTHIAGSELLSANKRIVASVVFPATGNTIAKLAGAITDTPVTMAVKALLRNSKPCIIGISTNDALSGNAANIGLLLNRKNYYFVPFSQDDFVNKPFSCVCDFSKVGATIELALKGRQLQPIIS